MMTVEQLRLRLAQAEANFNAARVRLSQAEDAAKQADYEVTRFQGEYRAIAGLLRELEGEDMDLPDDPTAVPPMPEVKVEGEPAAPAPEEAKKPEASGGRK